LTIVNGLTYPLLSFVVVCAIYINGHLLAKYHKIIQKFCMGHVGTNIKGQVGTMI